MKLIRGLNRRVRRSGVPASRAGRTAAAESRRRRAVVTVMVLIVLILMSGLVAAFIRRAVADRRQMRPEQQHRQTLQLVNAGVSRLQQQLQADADYGGETWELPAGIIHQTNSARVVISVQNESATVTAHYPVNFEIPFRVTRIIRLSK